MTKMWDNAWGGSYMMMWLDVGWGSDAIDLNFGS